MLIKTHFQLILLAVRIFWALHGHYLGAGNLNALCRICIVKRSDGPLQRLNVS